MDIYTHIYVDVWVGEIDMGIYKLHGHVYVYIYTQTPPAPITQNAPHKHITSKEGTIPETSSDFSYFLKVTISYIVDFVLNKKFYFTRVCHQTVYSKNTTLSLLCLSTSIISVGTLDRGKGATGHPDHRGTEGPLTAHPAGRNETAAHSWNRTCWTQKSRPSYRQS